MCSSTAQVQQKPSRQVGVPQAWHCQEPAGVLTMCQLSAGGYLGSAAQRSWWDRARQAERGAHLDALAVIPTRVSTIC